MNINCEKCHYFCNMLNGIAAGDKTGIFASLIYTTQRIIMKACEKNHELMSDAIVEILEGKESPED